MRKWSRLFSEWVWAPYARRGTQTSFPLLESRSCEIFRLLLEVAHFSIFLLGKKSWSNRALVLFNCQFSDHPIEKWASPKFSQLRLSKTRKLIWVLVPLRVVRLIPRRAGSISSLYGAKSIFRRKKLGLQPKDKSRITNGLKETIKRHKKRYTPVEKTSWKLENQTRYNKKKRKRRSPPGTIS